MVTATGTGAWTETRTRMGAGAGARAGTETIIEMRVEREESPGIYKVISRGGSEDTIEGATPTSDQQPKPQDPTPQRDHHIMLRTKA